MVMRALREGAHGGILKYFLIGILVMAGGGLVFMDIGGFFRGGVTSTDAAKIGNQTISIQQFDRTARRSLQRLGMDPAQAYQLGYTRELLNGEIRTSLLQLKAADTGVRVGTQHVAENIRKILEPMAGPGQNPKDVFKQLLVSQGISEQELAGSMRREMTVNLISNAIQSGFVEASEPMALDLARYNAEQRDVRYIVFKDKDFKGTGEPDDEKLMKFYEGTKEAYATPEMRKSRIVLIETDKLKDSLEISDEEIQEMYDRNISSYSQPETRKIEQVILADAAKAEEIAKAVQDGKRLKDAVQSIAGNTTDYIASRSTEKQELFENLQEPVFTAEKNAVLGPFETGLGHHVIVLNKIIAEHITPLSKAKKELKEELTETRIIDAQYDLANSVDDFLASGDDLDTLKEELDVEIQDFPLTNSFGIGENGKATFTAAFGPDAQEFATSLFDLNEGEASPVMELADGRMAALVVEEIQDKSYTPFEEIKDELKKRWVNDSRKVDNKMQVLEILSAAKNDGANLDAIAKAQNATIKNAKSLKRLEEPPSPLTKPAIENIFGAKEHELFTLNIEGGAAIALVQKSKIPEKPKSDELTAAQNTLLQSLQNEAYTIYLSDLEKEYGVKVNEKLLEAVYGARDSQ